MARLHTYRAMADDWNRTRTLLQCCIPLGLNPVNRTSRLLTIIGHYQDMIEVPLYTQARVQPRLKVTALRKARRHGLKATLAGQGDSPLLLTLRNHSCRIILKVPRLPLVRQIPRTQQHSKPPLGRPKCTDARRQTRLNDPRLCHLGSDPTSPRGRDSRSVPPQPRTAPQSCRRRSGKFPRSRPDVSRCFQRCARGSSRTCWTSPAARAFPGGP